MTPLTVDALIESFTALAAKDYPAARRAMAKAQVEHYGFKPWAPGAPELDALGNRIVYKDVAGVRYTVHNAGKYGQHIRRLVGFDQFSVHGLTTTDMHQQANAYVLTLTLREPARLVRTGTDSEGLMFNLYDISQVPLD